MGKANLAFACGTVSFVAIARKIRKKGLYMI